MKMEDYDCPLRKEPGEEDSEQDYDEEYEDEGGESFYYYREPGEKSNILRQSKLTLN